MTTVQELQAASRHQELHWLVDKIVRPELPHIIEALQICSNLILYNSPQHPDPENHIERGPSITLPVSSGKLEALKGIVVRDGAYITKMAVSLKDRSFNRVISRLHLTKPMLLQQIITAKRSIDAAIMLMVQADSIFDVEDRGEGNGETTENVPEEPLEAGTGLPEEHKQDKDSHTHSLSRSSQVSEATLAGNHAQHHIRLISVFSELLKELQTAKNCLQLPTEPSLVFPLHVVPLLSFEPELPPQLALDVYVSQAEVCLDLKDLHRVTEKPWAEVYEDGKSYVDRVRDKMSNGVDDLDSESTKDESVLGNVFSHLLLRPKYEPHDYITRCVTYNGAVVMVNKKIEVLSADPVLVSAFTKLDSVEYVVSSFMENIQKLL